MMYISIYLCVIINVKTFLFYLKLIVLNIGIGTQQNASPKRVHSNLKQTNKHKSKITLLTSIITH